MHLARHRSVGRGRLPTFGAVDSRLLPALGDLLVLEGHARDRSRRVVLVLFLLLSVAVFLVLVLLAFLFLLLLLL